MGRLLYVIFAVLVAFVGCWLCQSFIPAGAPRVIGEVLSVVAGFGLFFGGPRLFPNG